MVGEYVVHNRFGRGRVASFDRTRIAVAFESGEQRTFAYPLSVGRFLRFERAEAQQRAERDREQADITARELAEERHMMERQRAEEASRQRMEALHDKRVAAAKRTAARSAAARQMKTMRGEAK